MAKSTVSIKIIDKKFNTKILKGLSDEVNRAIAQTVLSLRNRIKPLIIDIFKRSPIYNSLISGRLNAEFGFHAGTAQAKVDAIVEKISNSIVIEFVPYRPFLGKNYKGHLRIYVSRTDYSEILTMVESQISVSKDKKNYDLKWLEWLLLRGGEVIVFGHQFVPINLPYSRSGGGVMFNFGDSSYWRVPSEFSGTPGDNWITRTIKDNIKFISESIGKIVQEEISRKFK